MPKDLIDPAELRKAREKQAELIRLQELSDLEAVMSTEAGRRFVWRLLDVTGIYRSSYTGNADTYFREGQRNVGLLLINDIHAHCPALLAQAMAERRKRADDDTA